MQMIDRLVARLSAGCMFAASACVVLMMAQICVDVVLKYCCGWPVKDTIEIVSYYYMIGVAFLPLAATELRGQHIHVDLFVDLLPRRARTWIFVGASIVSAGFVFVLAWQSGVDALESARVSEVPMGTELIIWPSRAILPVSFALLGLVLLLGAAKRALGVESPALPASPSDSVVER